MWRWRQLSRSQSPVLPRSRSQSRHLGDDSRRMRSRITELTKAWSEDSRFGGPRVEVRARARCRGTASHRRAQADHGPPNPNRPHPRAQSERRRGRSPRTRRVVQRRVDPPSGRARDRPQGRWHVGVARRRPPPEGTGGLGPPVDRQLGGHLPLGHQRIRLRPEHAGFVGGAVSGV
jgi:hypothetical protein